MIIVCKKIFHVSNPVTARCFLCFERDTKGANVMYILQCAVANANRQTAAKMTNDILHGIWNIEYLASHSLTGTGPTDRTALPTDIVNRVIGTLL